MEQLDKEYAATALFGDLLGKAPCSPAGPLGTSQASVLPEPPVITQPRVLQTLRFTQRHLEFLFRAKRELGDVFGMGTFLPGPRPVMTCHPDHVKSLFTSTPEEVVTTAGESQLRPLVGPSAILTAVGDRHLHQRKLLLPHFHSEAISRYMAVAEAATYHELDRWPLGRPFPLAPRMRAITLETILFAVFGAEQHEARRIRVAINALIAIASSSLAQIVGLINLYRKEPKGLMRMSLDLVDRPIYSLIEQRRSDRRLEDTHDVLSMLLQSRTADGNALSDKEVRDELLSLTLAGYETTATSLAWTWERLLRNPKKHTELREAIRGGEGDDLVQATIVETLRSRPVIPIVSRRVNIPWRLGSYVVPAETPVSIGIYLLHHREDLYPHPFEFRPERWLDSRPGTYEWIPFGGGTRRCLGSSLAMAQQSAVVKSVLQRLDLEVCDPTPERAMRRYITMVPSAGARAVIRRRYS